MNISTSFLSFTFIFLAANWAAPLRSPALRFKMFQTNSLSSFLVITVSGVIVFHFTISSFPILHSKQSSNLSSHLQPWKFSSPPEEHQHKHLTCLQRWLHRYSLVSHPAKTNWTLPFHILPGTSPVVSTAHKLSKLDQSQPISCS